MVGFEEELKEAERLIEEGEELRAAEKYIHVAERLDARGDYLAAAQIFLKAAEIYRKRGEYYGAANAFKDAMIRFLVAGKLEEALMVAESVKEEEIRSSPTFAFTLAMLDERRGELEKRGGVEAEAFRMEEAEPLGEEEARKAVGTGKVVWFKRVKIDGRVDENVVERVFASARKEPECRVFFKLTGRSERGVIESKLACELVPVDPPYYLAEVELEAPWGEEVEEVVLEGLVPEGFEVADVEGGRVEEVKEGSRVIFKVGRVMKGDKVKFRVNAARRTARTIVIRRGRILDVIKLYLPVNRSDDGFIVSSEVYGVAGGMDELLIEDEIPLEFSIVKLFPEEGDVKLVERESTLVRRRLGGVKEGEKVIVGCLLERRRRAMLFEREVRLIDGRPLLKAIKTVEPIEEGKYVVQVSVKNVSRGALNNVELTDVIPEGHVVNLEACEATYSKEKGVLTWRIPSLGEGEIFEDAYWATGNHLQHRALYVKIKGYEAVKVEASNITRYRGTLEGGKRKAKRKSQEI